MAEHSIWPGHAAPRHIAAEALEAVRKAKPMTADETWAIVDQVIAKYPGCLAENVRVQVRAAFTSRRKSA